MGKSPQLSSPQRRSPVLPAFLLFVVAFLVFSPALFCGFIGYDDPSYVTQNPHVRRGLTLPGVKWALTTFEAANWHPLTWLSHMLDCDLFGLRPWGHHLTSILFHSANASLLFLAFRTLTGNLWRSFALALLFALHPLQVQSVAWVAERKNVLSTFFFLLTLLAYARYAAPTTQSPASPPLTTPPYHSRFTIHHSRLYLLPLLLFTLALLSKPMVVTLPFILLLLDHWPLKRQWSRGLLLEKTPFLLAAVVTSILTYSAQRQGGAVVTEVPFANRIGNALVAYCRYLAKLFYPVDLAAFYPPIRQRPAFIIIAAALLLLLASFGVFLARKKHPAFVVGWLWFLGTLVPVIGVIQAGEQSMADRYFYLPGIGILLLLVWGFTELVPDSLPRWRLGAATCALAAFSAAGLTLRELRFWKDTETLFRHALATTKDNYVAHNNLGVVYEQRGDFAGAANEFREALLERPEYSEARKNLGIVLDRQGHADDAIQEFEKVLKFQPKYPEARNALGRALSETGQFDHAIEQYQAAIAQKPDFVDAHYNLGVTFAMSGRLDQAASEYQSVLDLDPSSADAHNNLGFIFLKTGNLPDAISHFQSAIRLRPDYATAHFNLGVALANNNDLDAAISQFQQALQFRPNYPEAQKNLAALLAARKPR